MRADLAKRPVGYCITRFGVYKTEGSVGQRAQLRSKHSTIMSPLDIVLLLVSFHQVIGSDFSAMSLEFKQCVRGSQKPKIGECLGRSALNFIQKLDESDNVKFVEDFVTVKSETAAVRSLSNVLDTDPVDFRGILENAGAVMGQRSMEWHMDGLYPGLMFKIGPTADANSVAEFVLDGAAQGERQFGFEDPSTGMLSKSVQIILLIETKLKRNIY